MKRVLLVVALVLAAMPAYAEMDLVEQGQRDWDRMQADNAHREQMEQAERHHKDVMREMETQREERELEAFKEAVNRPAGVAPYNEQYQHGQRSRY